jgi:hypothetical protein
MTLFWESQRKFYEESSSYSWFSKTSCNDTATHPPRSKHVTSILPVTFHSCPASAIRQFAKRTLGRTARPIEAIEEVKFYGMLLQGLAAGTSGGKRCEIWEIPMLISTTKDGKTKKPRFMHAVWQLCWTSDQAAANKSDKCWGRVQKVNSGTSLGKRTDPTPSRELLRERSGDQNHVIHMKNFQNCIAEVWKCTRKEEYNGRGPVCQHSAAQLHIQWGSLKLGSPLGQLGVISETSSKKKWK